MYKTWQKWAVPSCSWCQCIRREQPLGLHVSSLLPQIQRIDTPGSLPQILKGILSSECIVSPHGFFSVSLMKSLRISGGNARLRWYAHSTWIQDKRVHRKSRCGAEALRTPLASLTNSDRKTRITIPAFSYCPLRFPSVHELKSTF